MVDRAGTVFSRSHYNQERITGLVLFQHEESHAYDPAESTSCAPPNVKERLGAKCGTPRASRTQPDRKTPCFRRLGKQGEWPRLESNQWPAV